MAAQYSSGRNSLAICDICGFQYKHKDLKEVYRKLEPTGLLACPPCWDKDHPQLTVGMQETTDPQGIRNARPDSAELAASRAFIIPIVSTPSFVQLGDVEGVIG